MSTEAFAPLKRLKIAADEHVTSSDTCRLMMTDETRCTKIHLCCECQLLTNEPYVNPWYCIFKSTIVQTRSRNLEWKVWIKLFLPHTWQNPLSDLTRAFGPGRRKNKKNEGRESLTFSLLWLCWAVFRGHMLADGSAKLLWYKQQTVWMTLLFN